jgi:hypothetical protein
MGEPAKQRVIRRARLKASLVPLGSLAFLLAGAGLSGAGGAATWFSRLTTPLVLFLLCLLIGILFPAYMRIYYVLLLGPKGVFSAQERQTYQHGKIRWERYLIRAACMAGGLVLLLGAWVRWH